MPNKSMYLGAATENHIVSMLLKEEREVYLPVVDDHGVDILVMTRNSGVNKNNNRYQEIQVKSKTYDGLFAAVKCPNPQPNYWFIFYVRQHDTICLINSMDFVKIASQNKKGKNIGLYSLSLATNNGIRKAMQQYIVSDFSRIP